MLHAAPGAAADAAAVVVVLLVVAAIPPIVPTIAVAVMTIVLLSPEQHLGAEPAVMILAMIVRLSSRTTPLTGSTPMSPSRLP